MFPSCLPWLAFTRKSLSRTLLLRLDLIYISCLGSEIHPEPQSCIADVPVLKMGRQLWPDWDFFPGGFGDFYLRQIFNHPLQKRAAHQH